MAENPDDAEAASTGPVPRPRNLSRSRTEGEDRPPSGDLDKLVQLAAKVRALTEMSAEALAEASAAKGGHRFQRAPGADKRPSDTSPPAWRPSQARATDGDDETPGDESAPPAPRGPPGRSAGQAQPGTRATRIAALQRHPYLVWIVVQAFAFGLVLLGALLGEAGSKPAAAVGAPVSPGGASPHPAAVASSSAASPTDEIRARALHTADLALAAENAGDFATARDLLESVSTAPAALPGIDYQLALLALRRGDRSNAELHLERSLIAGEAIAPSCYLHATLAAANGNFGEASRQLLLGCQAEPFNGHYFFYAGESLRREGKSPAAIAALRQALARPATAEEGELYQFKLRLAQVESGRDDAFDAELEEKIRQSAPLGDWLLLAAAQNLQRGALAAAGEFLQRAASALPPETYRLWTRDASFQKFAASREVNPYLQVPPMPAAPPRDPSVMSVAEADPALWPLAK